MLLALSVLFFLVFVVFFITWAKAEAEDVRKGAGLFSAIGLLLAGACFAGASVVVVPSGHVGVPIVFGSVRDHALPEGMHFVSPLAIIKQMSIRTENYWMSHVPHEGAVRGDDAIAVRSSNGMQMTVDVCAPYRLLEERASWVYQNLGEDYASKVLRPALSTATRQAASKYTAEELYSTKLEQFATDVSSLLNSEIDAILRSNYALPPAKILSFSNVFVGYIGVPDSVKTAIENKLRADQEQQAMEFAIMKEKKEAERKRVEAEGIQAFQEIVTKGIDDRLLRWKAIDATLELAKSHNAKVIVIGGGKDGLPVLLNGTGDASIVAEKSP